MEIKELLVYILPFVVFSPILIIGIKKFIGIFGYKKANIEYAKAKRSETNYDSMWHHARTGISYQTYGYKKTGVYIFSVDGKEYKTVYSSDRDHGYLPDEITVCYPKSKPQKAFAEGNTPFIKEFFHSFVFFFVYGVLTSTALMLATFFLL